MTFYNEPSNYTQLNSKSDKLSAFLPVAKEIATLAKGGYELKATDYLLIRDNEETKITEKRIEKFAPQNFLGAAIRLQRTKQNSGELDIHSDTLPGDPDLWNKILNDVDRQGSTFKDFVIGIFESSLISKIAYVQVELESVQIPSGLNQAQVDAIKEQSNRTPYVVEIPADSMLAESVNSDGCNWFKYKRVVSNEDPLIGTQYDLEIILVDNQNITTWTFYNVHLDANNDISEIWDQTLVRGEGGYRQFNPDKDLASPVSLDHNRGECPLLKFELPDSLWMANQVYKVQAIIYGLHMNLLHTAANAGFIQKWGKPLNSNSSGSGVANAPLSTLATAQISKKIAETIGDESMQYMDSFQFAEISGESLTAQQAIIDNLKLYIFTTISLNQATQDPNQQAEISGRSKEVDLHLQNVALQDHGTKIIKFSNDLLTALGLAMGESKEDSLNATTSGMTRFDIKPLSDAISTVQKIFKLPKIATPKELVIEAMYQLSGSLLTNHSFANKAEIRDSVTNAVNDYYNVVPVSNIIYSNNDDAATTSNTESVNNSPLSQNL